MDRPDDTLCHFVCFYYLFYINISMKALKYGLVENALKSLKAGCNLTLYCQGRPMESLKLLKKIPPIDEFTEKKTSQFYNFLR